MNRISPAQKKKQEERKQWMILGVSMGALLFCFCGLIGYILLKQRSRHRKITAISKPISPKQITKHPRRQVPGLPDAPLPAASEPDADIYSTSLDSKSIAKASEYKNRHNAGRLHSSRVKLSRSPYTAKIENRREKDARIKMRQVQANGTASTQQPLSNTQRQNHIDDLLGQGPQAGKSAKQMGENMKNLDGQ